MARERREQVATGAGADPAEADDFAFVARQPIFDPALAVTAYELLYRASAQAKSAAVSDPSEATLRVIASAALDIGLDRLTGGLPVHVNFPRELLVSEPLLPVRPRSVVIEVLEDVPADPQVVAGIAALRERGHLIALDDFSPHRCDPRLLELADIVKICLGREAPETLPHLVRTIRRPGLRLIAEQVETVELFERCVELGFEGFQGNFLQHPETFRTHRVPASRLGTLRLLAALQSDEYAVKEIERLVSQDVGLTYRVLRCINSSYYNLPRRIDSIHQGIVILGLENLRRLCTIVSLLGFTERPASLLTTAMVRGRMCERLGRLGGARDAGPHFITGLFSMLGLLLGMPLEEVLGELPLAEPVARALLAGEGDLGAALRCARAYEAGRWSEVSYRGLAPNVIRAAYVEAVFWAEETRTALGGHAA